MTVAMFASAATIKGDEPVYIHLNEIFQIAAPNVCNVVSKDQLALVELRMNGVLTTLKPFDCNPDPVMNKLSFFLPQLQGDNSDRQRETLLGSPWRELKSNFQRDMPFNVSFNNGAGIIILATGTLRFQVLQPPCIIAGFAVILLVGYVLLRMGRDSTLLRDRCTDVISKCTYSLARVQMAWWFFIVFASYVWLWIVGEGIPDLSTQALGLLGIGSGTYLVAAGVDVTKENHFGESQGFFIDILSDAQGLALYRFQMLVFNVLFGFLFVIYVVQHVSMPDFDSSVLTLLGMSAGTYAGFKIPEKQDKSAVNRNANAGGSPAGAAATGSTAAVVSADSDPKQSYTPEN